MTEDEIVNYRLIICAHLRNLRIIAAEDCWVSQAQPNLPWAINLCALCVSVVIKLIDQALDWGGNTTTQADKAVFLIAHIDGHDWTFAQ